MAIAQALVAENGAAALTLNAVAQSAGVKAPSLYKHFADRDALLKAVEIAIIYELEAHLRTGTKGTTARERIASMASCYRTFAKAAPHRYFHLYSRKPQGDPEHAAASLFSAMPLFDELRNAGVGEARLLPLARALVAFLHGFVSMELVGAFQLGGNLEEAFTGGIEIILREL